LISLTPTERPQHRTLAWIPVVLWMALISWLSSDGFSGSWSEGLLRFWVRFWNLPVSPQVVQIANLMLRKTAHFAEFFVLGVLLSRAIWQYAPKSEGQAIGRVLLAGALYAMADEFRQAFTTSRGSSLLDAGLDFTGVMASQLWMSTRRGRLWRFRSPSEP
jgi:VanZ family protein